MSTGCTATRNEQEMKMSDKCVACRLDSLILNCICKVKCEKFVCKATRTVDKRVHPEDGK